MPAVHEAYVDVVQGIFDVAVVIADAIEPDRVHHAMGIFKARKAIERRRLACAEISEDQADGLAHGITRNANILGERLRFSGLFDTLPRAVVFPAVVKTANGVFFDPAHRQLCAAVRAAISHQVRRAALAAVQGKVFAHDPDRHGPPRENLMGTINRLPESAQERARQRPRPGGDKIIDANRCRHKMILLFLS